MKKIKVLALCAIVAGVVTSCQKDEVSNETAPVVNQQLSKAQINALLAGGINPNNAFITSQTTLDGVTKEGIMADDVFVAMSQLNEIALSTNKDGTKQFRTNNLVTGANRTIDILGYTGSGNALTGTMQTGLRWAVDNYNRLGLRLNFRLTFGTNFQAADMVVYNNNRGGGGGSAGFPSGGRANKFIQINAGTSSFGNNVNEHVIGHEIGHSIGFRHQDWRSRQSCGQNSNEGTAGVGAILINGTPSSDRADSIMLACFGSNEDGEFTNTDITALRALYQ
ncbi:peptidase [Aquimarina sp. AD10]|uniref:Peptidase n=1 Tax=Aquimarina aggregata TaxID=1642818 RepID=A0A163ANJ1_9FLAO|nr:MULTISPECIES: M57 family metalloprotease [Aquimarina]AXT62988.1 peptidase [Aquimarina sp. AD10]KZS40678.1 hypothetical protein AWE51_06935 [Aquimarina aggregata]RKM92112.1 peptidase [Aquimarina sp. AD10]